MVSETSSTMDTQASGESLDLKGQRTNMACLSRVTIWRRNAEVDFASLRARVLDCLVLRSWGIGVFRNPNHAANGRGFRVATHKSRLRGGNQAVSRGPWFPSSEPWTASRFRIGFL